MILQSCHVSFIFFVSCFSSSHFVFPLTMKLRVVGPDAQPRHIDISRRQAKYVHYIRVASSDGRLSHLICMQYAAFIFRLFEKFYFLCKFDVHL